MKNIHVLPTDKPSNITIRTKTNELMYSYKLFSCKNGKDINVNQNIYITSDEYIGLSYYLDGNLVRKGVVDDKDYWEARQDYKKIILTTDQDLIKDGVQAINDEFLEWFVKNPSCEEVKVGEIYPSNCCINKEGKTKMNNDCMERNRCLHYKIIITSKDDLKIGDNTNFGIITDINEKSVCFGKNKVGVDVWYKKSYVVKFPNLVLEEPKQETLEEAAENLYPKDIRTHYSMHQEEIFDNNSPERNAFIEGAKWQKIQDKNKFSEEEIRNIAEASFSFYRTNEFSDDELEVEWKNWLEKRIQQLKNK